MLKHYVREYYPGIMVSDSNVKEIESREAYKSGDNCYAYQFYDVMEDEVEVDGKMVKRSTTAFNTSPTYYKGTVKTIEEIAVEQPGSILYENMRCNKWNRVVTTRYGQAFPLKEEDIVI